MGIDNSLQRTGIAVIDILTEPTEQAQLIALFERIAFAEGWLPGDALRRYGERSIYIAAFLDERMQGGAQLVLPDAVEALPGQEVWPEVDQTGAKPSAHVAVLALLPEARGHHSLFGRLCVKLWRQCCALGVQTLWLEATPATLKIYRRMGWPLEVVGELREHWGESCFLSKMGVDAVAQSLRQKAVHSEMCREWVRLADKDSLPDAWIIRVYDPLPE